MSTSVHLPCPDSSFSGFCELLLDIRGDCYGRLSNGQIHSDRLSQHSTLLSITVRNKEHAEQLFEQLKRVIHQFLEERSDV